MRHRIHQNILLISCLLLVFCIPVFPKLLPVIILFMFLNWAVSGIYLRSVPRMFTARWRIRTLSFASLYLFYMAGMLYSTDYAYGWFDLEVKFSLLIFPIIFATSDLSVFIPARIRHLFGVFLAGCIAGSLVFLGHAWIVNERHGVPDAFYYTNLSWYFHSSYLAMYYTFGAGIALSWIAEDFFHRPVYKMILLSAIVVYLQALIFLLSSKAGLITLSLTEILFVFLLIYKKINIKSIILTSVILAILFLGFSRIFPYAFSRISRADSMISSAHSIQSNPTDGTLARMEIWKVSVGLIRHNFLFGVGTGDVKDVLMEAYQKNNLFPVFRKKLNAHNQYVQTFIALGVFGFGLLVATLLVPLYRALRSKSYLYALFILIFLINILFESMLETQAGVVFYAFFNVLLFSINSSATVNSEIVS